MKTLWISRKPFARVFVMFAFLAAVLFVAQPARSDDKQDEKKPRKHVFWVVKSKTATVYLLGSVHVAKAELYPLDKVIEDAFNGADVLGLEIKMDQQAQIEAGTKLLAVGRFAAGKSLDKELSKEMKTKLDAYLKKRMVPAAAFNQFKPWLVSILLTMQELQRHGFDAKHGIDQHFFKRAEGKKTVVGLETVDDQVNMFKGMPAKEQATMLEQTLDQIDELNKLMTDTFKAWKTGDTAKIDELMIKPMRKPEFKKIFKAMFTDRNIKMAQKVEGFLKTDKTYFVVVGSAHLIGEGSVVDLLRKKKLKVKQL